MPSLHLPVTVHDHIQGHHNASIVLIVYGDYECPQCAQAYAVIKRLQRHFGDHMQYIFRHFPSIQVHPNAKLAAEVTEFCAAHGRFWDMHDLIFTNQHNISLQGLLGHAAKLELPVEDLKLALENKIYSRKIERDLLGGASCGVNSTPTYFINGQLLQGAQQFEDLAYAIDLAFAK